MLGRGRTIKVLFLLSMLISVTFGVAYARPWGPWQQITAPKGPGDY